MLSIATGIQDFPDSAYPLVHDQPDPAAARKAWSSINTLLDHRAQHQGDKRFLCCLDLDRLSHEVYTFRQGQEYVVQAAKAYARTIAPAHSDKGRQVIGVYGANSVDYWVNGTALQRL